MKIALESISLLVCVQPTYSAQEYQTFTDTALSEYQFTPWLSRALTESFFVPTEIHARPEWDSNHDT